MNRRAIATRTVGRLIYLIVVALPVYHAAGSASPAIELSTSGEALPRTSASSRVQDSSLFYVEENGLFAPSDGRFDYPPRVVDSWADFAGTTYMTALYTQLALVLLAGRICGFALPLGGLVGPAACIIIVAVVGFVSAGMLYAVGTYLGGKVRYRARLSVWCERQTLFAIRNEKYEDLCTPPNETRAQHSD